MKTPSQIHGKDPAGLSNRTPLIPASRPTAGQRFLAWMIGAGTLSLGACTVIIKEPANETTFRAPNPVHVVVTANADMSNLVVKDVTPNATTDITHQMSPVIDNKSTGDLVNLSLGRHRITAEARVYCWYCSGLSQQTSTWKDICIADASWPSTSQSYTSVGMSNGNTWTKTSDTTVGIGPDTGSQQERWNFIRTGGITQTLGLVQSTENSCLCLRSMDTQQNTPIGLALCDASEHTQLWQALELPTTQGHSRFQNLGRSTSSACLTQGPNNTLIQRSCLDTGDQLWKVKDKDGNFVLPFQ